jgi:hypothetical protein
MTARFKDFGSTDTENSEPLSFKIHGEDFKCVPNIQGKTLMNLVASTEDMETNPSKGMQAINGFFDAVLEDESLERFNLLLVDKKKIVSVETLSEIVGWLMEQYTNRPEEQPEV